MIDRLRKRIAQGELEGGFTLIELLVVIIIIGILLAIAVPSYLGFRDRANDSAAKANVRAIVPAIEAFYSDHGTYVGMHLTGNPNNPGALDASYDQSIDPTKYSLSGVAAATYCISSTSGSKTWRKVGPAGQIVSGVAC
jgi:type IV pilus assembly protein PilA